MDDNKYSSGHYILAMKTEFIWLFGYIAHLKMSGMLTFIVVIMNTIWYVFHTHQCTVGDGIIINTQIAR